MDNRTLFLKEIEDGHSTADVARKYGVSRQYVQQVSGKWGKHRFLIVTEKQCIYPNWRKWMNENKVSRAEISRRIGNNGQGLNIQQISDYMSGKRWPHKNVMDRLLLVTGMTYEEMFSYEEA